MAGRPAGTRIFKLDNQWIFETPEYLAFHIDEPYWGAGKIYGWEGAGLGINQKLIELAKKRKKELRVSFYKNRKFKYRITPTLVEKRAKQFNSYYEARGKVKLLVVPIDSLKKEKFDG